MINNSIIIQLVLQKYRYILLLNLLLIIGLITPGIIHAERIRDLATIQGVRGNQLIGYGLAVGLDGTGDMTVQTPFTVQSIANMLGQLGINLPPGTNLQLRNVAAVMVTATLPAFAKPGQHLDVTVSSLGNARSLRGGQLLLTPLKGADNQVYAIAQGSILVGGVGVGNAGSSVQINHLNAGRIAGGGIVEREVATSIGENGYIHFELNSSDFTNVNRIVDAINGLYPSAATAIDGRMIQVKVPEDANQRVMYISQLENLDIVPAKAPAKVIVNSRTGSVAMNQTVTLETSAIAHGNLTIIVNTDPVISQPNPLAPGGETVVAQRSQVEIRTDEGNLMLLPNGANLGDVVKALTAIGATTQDLLSILQALKAAGSLRADLEII